MHNLNFARFGQRATASDGYDRLIDLSRRLDANSNTMNQAVVAGKSG